MKLKELDEFIHADKISKYKGIYTFRRGFFYTMGGSSTKFRESIEKQLEAHGVNFETIEDGERWTNFIGGAPIEKQSHWYVKLIIRD